MTNKAYNIVATQLTAAKKGSNSKGTPKLTFRVKTSFGGREIERTVLAQGKSVDLLKGLTKKGAELKLRVIPARAPANEDGSKGGEYFTLVDLPRAKAA